MRSRSNFFFSRLGASNAVVSRVKVAFTLLQREERMEERGMRKRGKGDEEEGRVGEGGEESRREESEGRRERERGDGGRGRERR